MCQSLVLSCLLAGALLLSSCDTSINPLTESDLYFSIFGYLEAGADTQYLRITPVRDALITEPGLIDAEVVLEHLETGATTTFRDSLFIFRDNRLGTGEPAYAHNFWAVVDLEPGARYRLTVRRSDGATTTATVTLPEAFPEPRIFPPRAYMETRYSVHAEGIERLADVRLIYYVQSTTGLRRFEYSHVEAASRITNGYSTFLNMALDAQNMRTLLGQPPSIQAQEVQVAAGGPEWPPRGADLETIARTNAGNIKNGVGLFAGVVSVTVPWPDY